MSNPRKAEGTAWESELVRVAQAYGYEAWRLAEGGANDPGDIAVRTPSGDTYIVEAKCRTQLNIHDTLGRAVRKAEGADLPFVPAGVGVAWKRLVRRDGAERRVQAGPAGVFVTVDEWLSLIGR